MQTANMKSCLVLLGASEYPYYPELNNEAIAGSADAFRKYFTGTPELCVGENDILDLFDKPLNVSAQLVVMAEFLSAFAETHEESDDFRRNIFIVYVGHGLLHNARLHLAIADTRRNLKNDTALTTASIGNRVKSAGTWCRNFVILDCCFAGRALADILSDDGILEAEAERLFERHSIEKITSNPSRGSTLLCAVDADTPALAPRDRPQTVFTAALMDVLVNGSPRVPALMTMANIVDLVSSKLHHQGVEPNLHSPDQRDGDLGRTLGLFPNPRALSETLVPHVTAESAEKYEKKPEVIPKEVAPESKLPQEPTSLPPASKAPAKPEFNLLNCGKVAMPLVLIAGAAYLIRYVEGFFLLFYTLSCGYLTARLRRWISTRATLVLAPLLAIIAVAPGIIYVDKTNPIHTDSGTYIGMGLITWAIGLFISVLTVAFTVVRKWS